MGKRSGRLSARLLIASSVVTVIGFSAICASVMLDMRRGVEELARQSLENLATGIEADITRNIEVYDLSLRAVANDIVAPEIDHVSKPVLHLILFDHAATARHFGAIQVFDAKGQLTVDASSLDPAPENRAAYMPDAARAVSGIPRADPGGRCYGAAARIVHPSALI